MTVACAFDEVPDGGIRKVDVDGVPVSVVRIDAAVYAVADTCTHANVSLADGEVWCDELEIECPKHASAFSLVTGEPSTLPATQPVAVYDAVVVDGNVIVTARDESR
ncbi:MAG: Rieske 2Fe-2S domain-containing protein [Acidimicrobiia bacterium]|nr:Rieske 2Fe-2S domain-containing protein [Acidimicrobiia bacterium]